jgi:hypothetical protein
MRRFNRVEHVGKIVRPSSPILPIAENSGENFRRAAIARRRDACDLPARFSPVAMPRRLNLLAIPSRIRDDADV